MAYPLSAYIALRYSTAGKHNSFVAFINRFSVAGIALGLMSLIIVLSVMNGLETELRTRLLSMTAHATISGGNEGIDDWQALREELDGGSGIAGISPYVLVEGMLGSGSNLMPAIVRGVLPGEEVKVSEAIEFMRVGELSDLESGAQRIVLGDILALNLGVGVGNRVNFLIPEINNERPTAVLRGFTVSGIFSAGSPDHDSGLALIHLDDASELRGFNGRAGGVAIRLDDPMTVVEFAQALPASLSRAAMALSSCCLSTVSSRCCASPCSSCSWTMSSCRLSAATSVVLALFMSA